MNFAKYKLVVVFLLLYPGMLGAQGSPRVYFETQKNIYSTEETEIRVDLLLDSDTDINAFSLEIGYSVQKIAFLSADVEGSVVDVWNDFPPTSGEGILKLEGGIIKPFSGNRGKIIQLIFLPIGNGQAQISFHKAVLYLADGKGTAVLPETDKLKLDISSKAPPPKEIIFDSEPPRILSLQIVENPQDKARILNFAASDEESGVKETTVRWRRWFLLGESWKITSPAKIPADVWSGQLRIADGSGNAEVRMIIVWQRFLAKAIAFLLGAIVLLGIAVRFKSYIWYGLARVWKLFAFLRSS